MLQDYINRRLLAKNRSIYFKRGKWVFHALCVIVFWFVTYQRLERAGQHPQGIKAAIGLLLNTIPFFSFFYFYCLYLIPVCFKQRRYRQFWIILTALLLLLPWLEEGLQALLKPYGLSVTEPSKHSGWAYVIYLYREFIAAFLGFTTILFLMELVEGIRTQQETGVNEAELLRTEVQLLKTRMNPEFINRSLDDIIALSAAGSAAAPDAVVQFSDVLRYRLYRSSRGLVRLDEELQQLENLFRLQHTMPAGTASLEVEGTNDRALLTPMLLLNIAEHLLTTYSRNDDWSLVFYVLVEEAALQIAIELESSRHQLIDGTLRTIQEETERICSAKLNFETDRTDNNYSIRIWLPIQLSSTVSS